MEVAVILSPSLVILSGAKNLALPLRANSAKDLKFRCVANQCGFFAEFTLSEANGLRMTDLRESEARNPAFRLFPDGRERFLAALRVACHCNSEMGGNA